MGFGDLGKKHILTRTKIQYSKTDPLSDIVASLPITIDLVRDLLEINDQLLVDASFIKRIEKEHPQNGELLSDVYLNYLINTEGAIPKITSNKSFSALYQAAISFNRSLTENNQNLYFPKVLTNLYVYGFYKDLSLDIAPLESKDVFIDRLKVISQCDKYTAIPYMIDKKEKFIPFSKNTNSLRAYNTIVKTEGSDKDQICLLYWGLVLISLLNKNVNPLIREYFSALPDESHVKSKEIFSRFRESAREFECT